MKSELDTSTLSYRDRMAIEEHERLSPRLLYEIIRQDGIEELTRPTKALIFSGITAGLVVTFSFVFKAIFTAYAPNQPWAPLITNMGYTVGFLLVILGRMQLFTENTITTVVPLFNPLTWKKIIAVARLWSIVFASNLVGTALAALFLQNDQAFNPEFVEAMHNIALHVAHQDAISNILKGIPAGILIASVVWMMPSVNSGKFIMIFFFIYLIALGDFAHVVVGSAEIAYLVFQGQADLYDYFITFLLPTAFGNIVGGTVVFTMMIYGQVNQEIEIGSRK
ncbi:formate transporter [Mergibacter septicus]|uniref:Formate transporter n=1 Tax=Mergibacter septicus TaxID=221402 RepID=A0A8E3MGP4_9PAST|nr:formate/nitrite transporter family protein [Mergibacter septicus]AWX15641.1 formate transporter [Mergibacter septicus]QDJ13118.1 formate transporter [Mergibacter septicus]QDJ14895.1 formate transporter [Mergibacter septicus]UTU47679.1 formate/nitrite transporter family protein [Mergibacter septicus]WMR96716.1 formate/nitrite transporter family protein [Mergibacter septicus]